MYPFPFLTDYSAGQEEIKARMICICKDHPTLPFAYKEVILKAVKRKKKKDKKSSLKVTDIFGFSRKSTGIHTFPENSNPLAKKIWLFF